MSGISEQDERQIIEFMRVQAKMARAYYEGLIEQKFTPYEALHLTTAYVRAAHGPKAS